MTDTTGNSNRNTPYSSTARTPGADRAAGVTTETTRPEAEKLLEENPPRYGRPGETGTVADAVRAERSGAGSMSRRAQDYAHRASERAEHLYRDVQDYGGENFAAARRAASQHPMVTVLAAVGVGLAIGFLLGRSAGRAEEAWYDRADTADTGSSRYPYRVGQAETETGPDRGSYGYRVGSGEAGGGSASGSYGYRARYTE